MNELVAKYGGMVFTFVIWIAVFYFLLILPNKKKQKKHEELLNSLKEGSEVLTSGGIKGTVSSISPEYIVIRVDKGVNLTVKRSSIVTILK